jgi:hypothetical protein
MKPSPRTTDPLLAIQALLSSEEPNPVISFDGILYHIRDAEEEPDKGSFQILTMVQLGKYVCERFFTSLNLLQDATIWLGDNADTWLASARLAASWANPSTQIDTALRAISHD